MKDLSQEAQKPFSQILDEYENAKALIEKYINENKIDLKTPDEMKAKTLFEL